MLCVHVTQIRCHVCYVVCVHVWHSVCACVCVVCCVHMYVHKYVLDSLKIIIFCFPEGTKL